MVARGRLYTTLPKTRSHFDALDAECREIRDAVAAFDPHPSGKVINAPCCFDIESTSFEHDGRHVATMYMWSFAIGGWYRYGRTWEDFADLLALLETALGLGEDLRLVVYVHNLPYEFQWLMYRLEWRKVFAIRDRKVIRAETDCFEFRCSLALTGYSLANVGKNLVRHRITKAVGDLDYDLMRHSRTPLTDREIGYAVRDTLVVNCRILELIEDYGHISKIPQTKTGIVRRRMRGVCFNADNVAFYRHLMKSMQITVPEYEAAKRAYMGGFTHASLLHIGQTLRGVVSKDEASAYPAALVAEEYPTGPGHTAPPINSEEQLWHFLNRYCCIFDLEIVGLQPRVFHEHILSRSRCWVCENAVVDNGRVISADRVCTTLTDVDFRCLVKWYRWEYCRVASLHWWEKALMPTPFIEELLTMYEEKTTLKGVAGMEAEYMASKDDINSTYGMCCTDPVRPEYVFSDGWQPPVPPDVNHAIGKYNRSYTRFLSYLWGVFCTAYARRNLTDMIYQIGSDYVYADTDSVKYRNPEKHQHLFERYNALITARIRVNLVRHGIDPDRAAPKTSKGVPKPLGVWEDDGEYRLFKTLGAKRYMIMDEEGRVNLTVSGVDKRTAVPWLINRYGRYGVFNAFDDGLIIPGTDDAGRPVCGKLTHWYVDEPFETILADYRGVAYPVHELSCVSLAPSAYELSLSPGYMELLNRKNYLFMETGI